MYQNSDSQCGKVQEHENGERTAEAKIRKSSRERRLTPKMQELKEKEFIQKEDKLKATYEKWKSHVRETRRKLKQWCPEQDMCDMMDEVEKLEGEIKEIYDIVRSQSIPSQELRRKVDACVAASADLLQVMRIRLKEDKEDSDAVAENAKLHMPLDNKYARSIYGSTASQVTAPSANPSGHMSKSPSISVKRAEMAALLAAKEAEIDMEEAIEAQRQQLKKLENRRDIEVIKAQLSVYEEEEIKESIVGKAAQCVNAGDETSLCLRVAVKELPPRTPSAIIEVLKSDHADTKAGEKGISQDDVLFQQVLKEGLQQNQRGHCEMPIPFKAQPQLPDNKDAQPSCARGDLHFHKFLSNNREKLDSIDVAECAEDAKNDDFRPDDLPVQRVLGVSWKIKRDSFSFKDKRPPTRKETISVVASSYDHLSFLAPFIFDGKWIPPEKCRGGTGWDDPLPMDLELRWETWLEDLENLDKFKSLHYDCQDEDRQVRKVTLPRRTKVRKKGRS